MQSKHDLLWTDASNHLVIGIKYDARLVFVNLQVDLICSDQHIVDHDDCNSDPRLLYVDKHAALARTPNIEENLSDLVIR